MMHTDAADPPQPETAEETAKPQRGSGEIPRPNGQDLLQAAIDRLAALPELQYDLIDYKAEAERLGLDGVDRLKGLLKRAVGRARKAAEAEAKAAAKAAEAARKKAEAEAREKAKQQPPLTKAEIAAEIERLAGLDPADFNRERIHAKKRLGFTKVEMLEFRVNQVRQERLRKNPPPPPPPIPDSAEVTKLIAEFNRKYFVIDEDGRAIVYAPKKDLDQNRQFYERITFADLDKLYLNRTVLTGVDKHGEPVYERVATVWLQHHKRRQFIGGLVFDPSGHKQDEGVYNLWQGFSVKPRAGSWDKLREHTRTIICNGNADHFECLMDWMADVVQHPEKQGEVAIVLRGKEGTGKGYLARALKYLLGQHGFAISNARHLTGNFNGHLRDCVLLFADEALYAGNPAHVGILKSIITEPYLTIEGKYQNAVQSPNRLHIILASNDDWVVPAGLESRRFFVLNVSNAHANDHIYFGAIADELEHGGYEAMLDDLLHRDISQSNLRDVPVTAALVDQRIKSLDTTHAWWVDCLHRGYVFASQLGLEDIFATWIKEISTELLYASYERFARSRHERRPLNRVHFAIWLREKAGAKPVRPNAGIAVIVGEHIVDATTTSSYGGHTSRVAEPVTRNDRPSSYDFGTLAEARDAFTEATKLTMEWPDDDPATP
jgi:hypothetical protein